MGVAVEWSDLAVAAASSQWSWPGGCFSLSLYDGVVDGVIVEHTHSDHPFWWSSEHVRQQNAQWRLHVVTTYVTIAQTALC